MKVPDTKENMMKCICMKYPTHNVCMKEKMEGFFCSKGKATCELKEMGCICADCALWAEYKLNVPYYCVNGVV